jgi:hypothetical protein
MRSGNAVAAVALAALIPACAAVADVSVPKPAHPIALRNADFEAAPLASRECPSGWYCSMHADPHSFRYFHDEAHPLHGGRSLCMEPVTHEPWALLSQDIDVAALRGARIRFSAAVRNEAVTGEGAGPYVLARSHSGVATVEDRRLAQGTGRWRRVAVEITVPPDSLGVEFGIALQGRGRVCVDDAVLEIVQLQKSPV